ncbi:MAG: glycoside hydrolase, partial [Thermoplasmatales archaeon]|nr:glycoside hydrolase [Thermoplasmatales archaeon]
DNGENWSENRRLTYHTDGTDGVTGIVTCGSFVHVSFGRYVHYEPDNWWCTETYYIRSDDNGENWTEPVLVTPEDGKNSFPRNIAVNGSSVHMVWRESKDGNTKTYY